MKRCKHGDRGRLCDACRKVHNREAREAMHRAWVRRREMGLCGRCGKRPGVGGKSLCATCAVGPEQRRPHAGRPEHPLAPGVVEAFQRGEGPSAAAKRLGINRETAYRVLERRGLWQCGAHRAQGAGT